MSNTLCAGFFVGEFGWLLMRWQGIIRHIAKNYDNVIIGCEREYKYLFEDYATEFEFFNGDIETRNMWMFNGGIKPFGRVDADNIYPTKEICLNEAYHQDFIKYGVPDEKKQYDILIHARATDNFNTSYRNYPIEKWEEIVNKYPLKIASIGTSAHHITGTDDLRGIELRELANVMASSKVLLSPSSGPAHFASLCGLPHIVWSDEVDRGLYSNRERYATKWNPFKTENHFIPFWQPGINDMTRKIEKCLFQ